jgi:hypothetical protein
MKTTRSLLLENEDLLKLQILLEAIPMEASRNLPKDVRDFHIALYEQLNPKKEIRPGPV